MSFIKALFTLVRTQKSETDLLRLLDSLEHSTLDGAPISSTNEAALIMSPNNHPFFNDLPNSAHEILSNTGYENNIGIRLEDDNFGTKWIIFSGTNGAILTSLVDSMSKALANIQLADQMIAAVFKFNINLKPIYCICNYRTKKFYPFSPMDKKTRDTDLEMNFVHILSTQGIPIEPIEQWYALWETPF